LSSIPAKPFAGIGHACSFAFSGETSSRPVRRRRDRRRGEDVARHLLVLAGVSQARPGEQVEAGAGDRDAHVEEIARVERDLFRHRERAVGPAQAHLPVAVTLEDEESGRGLLRGVRVAGKLERERAREPRGKVPDELQRAALLVRVLLQRQRGQHRAAIRKRRLQDRVLDRRRGFGLCGGGRSRRGGRRDGRLRRRPSVGAAAASGVRR
jgi:hypothetical protein